MRQQFGGRIFAVLMAGSLLVGPSFAAMAGGPRGGDRSGPGLERMDVDKNGKIERDDLVARHKEMFGRLDLDGDGAVTLEEMRAAHEKMRAERQRQREEAIFADLDANGDGRLSEDELVARGEKAFAELDENGDGVISKNEMRHRMMDRMWQRRHHGMRGGGDGEDGSEGEGGGR